MHAKSLLDTVKKELERCKGKWPAVARGANIDYFTVVRIGSGKSKAPRYETIQKLADYFARAA